MKKHLLFATAIALASASMAAQEPEVYEGAAFNALSPDGNYAVSVCYGVTTIYDRVSGQYYLYEEGYETGNGNYVSNNGVVSGFKPSFETAAYWKNGEWHDLTPAFDRLWSYANGVTPDGSRLVGNISPESFTGGYEGLMLTPCYWDVQDDGTYGETQYLPYPATDLIGLVPQYVTAVTVSADGKTIFGQIQDSKGGICQPIVYKQAEDGSWSYTLILDDLFHPEGFVMPEYPGDDYPEMDDYMTAEELAAYEKALAEWEAAGGKDWDNYPNKYDYISEEALAQYEKDDEEYSEKILVYNMAYEYLCNIVPLFSFNNVFTNTDGTTYATTSVFQAMDPMTWELVRENTPYVIDVTDLENVTYEKYTSENLYLIITSIADDGTVLAQNIDEIGLVTAYIKPADSDAFETFYNYISSTNKGLGTWMEENLIHTYTAFDMETFETYQAEAMFTGIPFATPDLSLYALAVENFWYDWDAALEAEEAGEEYEVYVPAYGYIFGPDYLGVKAINPVGKANVNGYRGGFLTFTGEVKSVAVYGIDGTQVYSVSAPSGTVATGLSSGIYVVKVVATDGSVTLKKVAL